MIPKDRKNAQARLRKKQWSALNDRGLHFAKLDNDSRHYTNNTHDTTEIQISTWDINKRDKNQPIYLKLIKYNICDNTNRILNKSSAAFEIPLKELKEIISICDNYYNKD